MWISLKKEDKMTTIKIKNQNGILGYVAVDHWADPRIFMMDFQVAEDGVDLNNEKVSAGDFWPEYRENMKYVGVEEF